MSGQVSVEELIEAFQKEIPKIVADSVKQTLLQLGLDATNPIETQADMKYLRDWRTSVESLRSKSFWAVVSTLLLGLMGLLYIGLQDWIHRIPPPPP